MCVCVCIFSFSLSRWNHLKCKSFGGIEREEEKKKKLKEAIAKHLVNKYIPIERTKFQSTIARQKGKKKEDRKSYMKLTRKSSQVAAQVVQCDDDDDASFHGELGRAAALHRITQPTILLLVAADLLRFSSSSKPVGSKERETKLTGICANPPQRLSYK